LNSSEALRDRQADIRGRRGPRANRLQSIGKMEGLTVGTSDGRDLFITCVEAEAALDACPDSPGRILR